MDNFSSIYDQYIERIYRFVLLKVNSKETAEDITSEAFMRCFEAYTNNKEGIDNVQAFLYQIARNLLTDYYRQRGRTSTISTEFATIIDPSDIHDKAETKFDIELVKSVIPCIPDDYQDMIIWRYVEDLSVPEIAKLAGKSQNNVRVTIHRAIGALKTELEKRQQV